VRKNKLSRPKTSAKIVSTLFGSGGAGCEVVAEVDEEGALVASDDCAWDCSSRTELSRVTRLPLSDRHVMLKGRSTYLV
jgi:hypothetical protein